MTPFEQLIKQEHLQYNPSTVFFSLRDSIGDIKILKEICSHIDFNNNASFFESVKKFLVRYGKQLSLGDANQMVEQIGNSDDSSLIAYKRAEESIILTINRPSFLIRNDKIDDSITTEWKKRIDENSFNISKTIPSVGRIEICGHSLYSWVGTGWLIKGTDIIVTNRHVANIFASRQKNSFSINRDYNGKRLNVKIDFKEEYDVKKELEFDINEVIYITENDEPDLALLRVKKENDKGNRIPEGLKLSSQTSRPSDNVFVLGYPSLSTEDEIRMYDFIFKGISDVKRLSPGHIFPSSAASYIYMHDCSTWYGNSGSPIVDLKTGNVTGIHYAGSPNEYTGIRVNWAVRSTYLIELLTELDIRINL
jgi:endonuclease G